jgi:hypothetical protein
VDVKEAEKELFQNGLETRIIISAGVLTQKE